MSIIIIHIATFSHGRLSSETRYITITQEQAILLKQFLYNCIRNTRDQALNEMWHDERSKRITASNFGRVMLRKCSVTQKFIDSLLQKKVFTFAATSYGSANEKVATNLYRKILGTMSTTVAW